MQLKRVVITGLGAITPLGNDVKTFWDALEAGKSGCDMITHFDTTNFKTKFACEIKDFDITQYMNKKESRRLDLFAQYGMGAASQAMDDSGLEVGKNVDADRAGVIWGSGIGGIHTFQQEVTDFNKGTGIPRFNPFFIPKMIVDIVSGHISIKYGLRGPNFVTVSACASSTNALIDSFNYIRLGQADVIVSGGSEAAVIESGIGGFNAMKALSERNDSPQTASRPFDKNRDGFVMGEGGVSLILEELEHAKARGAKIYGEIIGGGMSADAHHMTAPHPEGLGAANVMKNALKDAEISPEDVDYINVHGTSTPLGDPQELKAIDTIFGEHAYKMNISSTKSMTGHLLGAAGAIEALACVMALERQIVPPTINFETPDETIDQKLNLTLNKAQKRNIDVVLSNTFGFGGHNASIVMRRYKE
ncbi:beta-ketoacyl-acyl-carrier-protein synthase II [Bernardetia litoralis DSM 6794]|uniref:3-oxoacyl-[acyl-carrier-protein] synthase 2 n=1 Tax=Bernardetia litoralis (strain ATCC 23117 / DSM 6794 / NBRC 15988 / NCIMB 1366 / Fx l1 / Sio-4) TaxID=880071 RepID=I4AJ03_BERLS|nr:beta-ketoacyl-ACP synthase II [Bernardetia litoralis]AFM03938.1 beta-ketoacyl-acyl-carrier-protein synthase II [Bernardetia litoralis DSM 6794]